MMLRYAILQQAPMALQLKALLSGIWCWRAPRSGPLAIGRQLFRLDHPRGSPAQLAPLDNAAANHAQRRHLAHAHDLRRCFERDLTTLRPLVRAMDGNAMMTTKRADPCL